MRTDSFAVIGRIIGVALAIVVLFSLFLTVVRPWYLTWGTTPSEASGALPGDELLTARAQSTRAITIAAPAREVWPWLLQLGQDRGGFYSYELLEDLVGTKMENVDTLKPELQHWKLGDKLWMYPKDKLGGAGHGVLQRLDPGQALVFGTRQVGRALDQPTDGTWAFVLRPTAANTTRLIVRGRAAGERSSAGQLFDRLVFEPVHFMMERKMMEGIKARAEKREAHPAADALEVLAFVACFALLVSALLRGLRWPLVRRSLLVMLAAGIAFQLLTFVQPPWIVGLVIVLLLVTLFEYADFA